MNALKTTFVFVDFENVQPENVAMLGRSPCKIRVFLGAHQSKIPLDTVRTLQAFGPDAEYIKIDGNGRNALDFHIAYYIGRLATENPEAHFHVISKDTGFDPLIKHLKTQGIHCERSTSIAEMSSVKSCNSTSASERVDAVVSNLVKRKAGKPRTLKTLRSTIKALFANQIADESLDGLIAQLTTRGVIKVTDGRVHYEIPS